MNLVIIYNSSHKINPNFKAVFSMVSNYKQSHHHKHLNQKSISKINKIYKLISFLMLILLGIKDLDNLDSKWLRIIIRHKCFMEIFNVERMMNLRRKIQINRYHKKVHNFRMILLLIILKRKENQKVKIQMKILLNLI